LRREGPPVAVASDARISGCAALDGWVIGESPERVRERAARSYDKNQTCGLNGACGLLVTGW